MKKFILIGALMVFFVTKGISQKNPWLSTEVNSTYYCFSKNTFNYGLSFLISENINRIKVSFGVEYSTLNLTYNYTPSLDNSLVKRSYGTIYINFPLFFSYRFFKSKKVTIGLATGFIFNKPYRSTVISEYLTKSPEEEKLASWTNRTNDMGIKFAFGIPIEYSINKKLLLDLTTGMDVVLINPLHYYDTYEEVPQAGSLFVSFGIVYNWKPMK